jgi:hypothetical protein
MPNYKIEVDGTAAVNVVTVDYETPSNGEIGTAVITVANTASNRSLFESGDEVVIYEEDRNDAGTFVRKWFGEVIGKPSSTNSRNLTIDVEVESKAAQLEYAKVSRPFIEMTTGEMVEQAIAKERDPSVGTETITDGSSLSGWSSNVDNFRLLDTDSDLPNSGGNAIYAEIPDGSSGSYYAEYVDVSPQEAPERRISKLNVRAIINDDGGIFDGTVTLVDAGGISYEWEFDLTGSGEFERFEFPVDDATVTQGGDPLTLRFEFSTGEQTPETRAFAVDYAESVPFGLNDRNVGVTVDNPGTDYVTTRSVNSSILQMVENFALEDGVTPYVDEDAVLHYLSSGDTVADVSIEYEDPSINVVNVDIDRDFDVRNRVSVEGRGDLQASYEDAGSIEFYNTEAPKEEPISDPTLRTRTQLRRRARGFLNENAWEDGALSFTLANPEFLDVNPGQIVPVVWPPDGINGSFEVTSVGRNSDGYVTISLSGTVSI